MSMPLPGPKGDRNPDALSSRIDQAIGNLQAIQSKMQGILISVRGSQPTPGNANGPLIDSPKVPDLITSMQILQSLLTHVETQVDELRDHL